eukprot:11158369-Lingulodinium_polyedra.AAC.1
MVEPSTWPPYRMGSSSGRPGNAIQSPLRPGANSATGYHGTILPVASSWMLGGRSGILSSSPLSPLPLGRAEEIPLSRA